MFVINYKNYFYFISGLLVFLSILSVVVFGLNFGIDFKGGSLIEVEYTDGRPELEEIKLSIESSGIEEVLVRPTEGSGFIIRTSYLEEAERLKLLDILSFGGERDLIEKRFSSVGPTVGSELGRNALISLLLVIVAVVFYVAFAFRKVSEPVSSWKYGLVTIISLLHDVIIPIGAFSVLGYFFEYQVDTLFVTALLVILGYSINDTIVVFDRVRENLRLNKETKIKESFEETVGKGIEQTFGRSINTSLTTLIALMALYFFGSETTEHFALALVIGITAGTYSSIFIASPLLVTIQKWQKTRIEN